jgi:hypothetical protein
VLVAEVRFYVEAFIGGSIHLNNDLSLEINLIIQFNPIMGAQHAWCKL